MTMEVISIGSLPNDRDGDPMRVAFSKTNNNFSSLFPTAFTTANATSTGLTQNQVILQHAANAFGQGLFQVKSYNPSNTDMQNIMLSASVSNNMSTVKFTAYGTTFDGNALCRYDMDVLGDQVRLLVNPIVNTQLNHFITYQVTD